MSPVGWHNCQGPVRRQVKALVRAMRGALPNELVGLYLHGSLAMGCFSPSHSDVDLLVVVRQPLAIAARSRLAELLLRLSNVPHPVEISVLSIAGLHPWRHPAPYEFHYSEDWRGPLPALLERQPPVGASAPSIDEDLAAHLTVARRRGVCLWGLPAAQVLPPIPSADFAASIVADLHWSRRRLPAHPIYFALNACRVLAFLVDGQILSKGERGEWGLAHLPEYHRALARQALSRYRGAPAEAGWPTAGLEDFAAWMESALQAAGDQKKARRRAHN